MAFKMRSEPLQRNFGMASPNKKIDTDPKRPDISGSRGGRLRTMPKAEIPDYFNPIDSNDKTMYDHLTTEGPKTKKE